VTLRPAAARTIAAARPLGPEPTTVAGSPSGGRVSAAEESDGRT
jgi:hypothetical protein